MHIVHKFQNVEPRLHIFLTKSVTNCSSEILFSFHKQIKNRLRPSLSQEKLEESYYITVNINFEKVIDVLAKEKTSKKNYKNCEDFFVLSFK